MIVFADKFQPFASRRGVDACVRVRFRYDPHLVDRIKVMLRSARHATGLKMCGGWLAPWRSWFVEEPCWGHVKRWLEGEGYTVIEDAGVRRLRCG
jgi:hypothetical protein